MFVHLAALYVVLEMKMEPRQAPEVLRLVLKARDLPVLERDNGPGELSVLHLLDVVDLPDYGERARTWAGAVWNAWDRHHALISRAVNTALG